MKKQILITCMIGIVCVILGFIFGSALMQATVTNLENEKVTVQEKLDTANERIEELEDLNAQAEKAIEALEASANAMDSAGSLIDSATGSVGTASDGLADIERLMKELETSE